MLLRDPSADVQPEPCPRDITRACRPKERSEERTALCIGHPEALIRYAEMRFGANDSQRDVDRRARRAVLDRVVQEISKDLRDPIGITLDPHSLWRCECDSRCVLVLV